MMLALDVVIMLSALAFFFYRASEAGDARPGVSLT